MVDKNGVEMKTGDIVRVSGAYFKNDNGLWFIERSPGDPSWCGGSYSLMKLKRNGSRNNPPDDGCLAAAETILLVPTRWSWEPTTERTFLV